MSHNESPSNTNKATASSRFAQALKRHDVKFLFGQSNPPGVTLEAAKLGIKQIGYRQENTGTYMADAYARISGKVPVVTAQNGPAATLLVAGLAECLTASIPIVAVVQDVALASMDKNAFQELDHVALFQGSAKWIRRIPTGARIEDYIDLAFVAASSGRPGPAVLLCPMDVINAYSKNEIPEKTANSGYYPLDRPRPEDARVLQAAKMLSAAKQPLIYAGGGVMSSGAEKQLQELQNLGFPVATTTMGKGCVDESHPLSVGVIGYYMARRGMAKFMNEYIQGADLILLVGNRTNQNGTSDWQLLPSKANYIQIDIEPCEIGRNYDALRCIGDARATLTALIDQLKNCKPARSDTDLSELTTIISDSRTKHKEEIEDVTCSNTGLIRPERIMKEANALLDDDHIVVADASFSSIWVANYISAKGKRRFLTPRGMAGLGWGFPMGLGAKIAAPKRNVFCVVGDGGFAHAWSELETAKRHGLKVVIAVMNNSILGYQYHVEEAVWKTHTNICEFTPVDHTLVAQACGLKGIRVETIDEIAPALEVAFASDETVLIDFIIDPNAMPPVSVFEKSKSY